MQHPEMSSGIDPLSAQRIGPSDVRCGTCAGWHWLTGLPNVPMTGRCTHPVRGSQRGLRGPIDGQSCVDWQPDDPF